VRDSGAMSALAKARPTALDPARLAGSPRQAADLEALLAAEPVASESARRGGRPLVLRTSVRVRRVVASAVSVTVVVSVTAIVLVLTMAGSDTPGPPVEPIGPNGGAKIVEHEPADSVLLQMAGLAESQSQAGTKNYWQVSTATGSLGVAGTGTNRYLISQTSHVVTSLGVRPGEQSFMVTGEDAATGPAAPRDLLLWRAAGSAKTVEVDEAGFVKYSGAPIESFTVSGTSPVDARQTVAIGRGEASAFQIGSGNYIATVGGEWFGYAELQDLPDSATVLRSLLDKFYKFYGLADGNGGQAAAENNLQWMFTQATNLITMPVPPAVRAAAYRLLAGLPGIEDLGPASDESGRSGLALALPAQTSGALGSVREEMLVNPQSDSILAIEQVVVAPSTEARVAGLKPGTVVDYTTITGIGWSDRSLALPNSGKD
jgi:hypothetical protein